MSSWMCGGFTDAQVADGVELRFVTEFMNAFLGARAPKETVIYQIDRGPGGGEGSLLYFSPAAAAIANSMTNTGLSPLERCAQPTTVDALIFGHQVKGTTIVPEM